VTVPVRRDAVDFAELYRRLDLAERLLEQGPRSPERRREVLARRAAAIAGRRRPEPVASISVLALRVAGERFALRLEHVAQVLEARGLCPVPGAPSWLLGLIVARARVLTVVDVRPALELHGDAGHLAQVVVVSAGTDAFGVGVEVVEAQLDIPVAELAPAPAGTPFLQVASGLGIVDPRRIVRAGPVAG
jgi:purine-binding chemotaxis protein CheW